MNGVRVKITKGNFPTPFGLEYEAKGAYIQNKNIIIVGNLKDNSTVRVKYPKQNVELNFF